MTYCKDHLQTVEHLNVLRQTFISPADQIILTTEKQRQSVCNNDKLLWTDHSRVCQRGAPDVGLLDGVVQRHEELRILADTTHKVTHKDIQAVCGRRMDPRGYAGMIHLNVGLHRAEQKRQELMLNRV